MHKKKTKSVSPSGNTPGERIRECRADRGLTQKGLAETANYTKEFISALENGRKPLTVNAADILATALRVRPEYLLCKDSIKTEAQYEAKRRLEEKRSIDIGFLFDHTNIELIDPEFSDMNFDSGYVYFRQQEGPEIFDTETQTSQKEFVYRKISKEQYRMIERDLHDYVAMKAAQMEDYALIMPAKEVADLKFQNRYFDKLFTNNLRIVAYDRDSHIRVQKEFREKHEKLGLPFEPLADERMERFLETATAAEKRYVEAYYREEETSPGDSDTADPETTA